MKKYAKHLNLASVLMLFVLTVIGILPLVGIGMAVAGSVGRAAGYPDYTEAGLNKLIPVLFSGEAREKFYERTCLSEISNTDFTGEIKNMGDKVIIPTEPDVTINEDYKKGQLLDIEYLESAAIEYTVDYAASFNFAVDDIDLKQFKIKDWISRYAGNAAKRVKISIERKLFSLAYADADSTNQGNTAGKLDGALAFGATGTPATITKTNCTDFIVELGQALDENDIPEDDRWIVIPAWMASRLKQSELKDASMMGDGSSRLLNGRIGQIDRFLVYSSNLLAKDAGTSDYHVLFGHKSALSFVSQFVKTDKYRPERAFADAMKGLNVWGFKVLQPTGLGQAVVKKG